MLKRTKIFVSTMMIAAVSSAGPPSSMSELRMTPVELSVVPKDDNQIGSSKLSGVHTKVLVGDPSKAGLYSMLLFVPPRTSIPAHSHRDNRMASVVSGTWHFGYGKHFDAKALKDLPPGSVYSEPGAGHYHFAQTGAEAVVVHITGFGPTDTHYFDRNDEPPAAPK